MTAAWPNKRAARLHIALTDRRMVNLSAANPRGGEDAPLSFDKVARKFGRMAEPIIGRRADEVVERVARLDELGSVVPLVALFTQTDHTSAVAAE